MLYLVVRELSKLLDGVPQLFFQVSLLLFKLPLASGVICFYFNHPLLYLVLADFIGGAMTLGRLNRPIQEAKFSKLLASNTCGI